MNTRTIAILAAFSTALISACSKVDAPAPCGPLPNENQLQLQDMETYAFIHYSMNTYTDQEWGYGNEDLALFNPSSLDTRQWVQTCKSAGMKGIIFTAKHHCGFCMWPSQYTEFSVKNTPWKDGKGDVVRELAEACREEGLRFAVYLSPWDRNHAEYGRAEYISYFRNQLTELLTGYGDMFEVWFDGANGGNGWYGGADETRKIERDYYDWGTTYDLVRSLQKDICIWGDNTHVADVRWIGNEKGFIGERNWSLLESDHKADLDELHHGRESGDRWVFGEADVSIRPGWFYHEREDERVKTVAELMDIYCKSVGRNGTLLLNFPVMPNGLIHPTDSARGAEFRKMVEASFSDDLALGASAGASQVRGGSRRFAASRVCDGDAESYWTTDDGVTSASVTLDFRKPVEFNRIMLCEYIRLGQRVRSFSLEALVNGEWMALHDISESDDAMSTIGRKRIIRLPENVTATQLRLNIIDSKACPLISGVSVFCAPEPCSDPLR